MKDLNYMLEPIILSQFWGLLLITVGVVYLLKKDLVRKVIEDTKDEKFSFTAGYMLVMLGIITFVLTPPGYLLLQLLSILTYAKGIILMGWPKLRYKLAKPFVNSKLFLNLVLIALIVIGFYFLR
jgi:predicted neutral ceramidase superfamily lipid hydrolase